ncbi:MAG: hypothetical protein R3D33_01910 [Hyphomicrobiaceae bacterium]
MLSETCTEAIVLPVTEMLIDIERALPEIEPLALVLRPLSDTWNPLPVVEPLRPAVKPCTDSLSVPRSELPLTEILLEIESLRLVLAQVICWRAELPPAETEPRHLIFCVVPFDMRTVPPPDQLPANDLSPSGLAATAGTAPPAAISNAAARAVMRPIRELDMKRSLWGN